jgi:hypothetical protein
MPSLKFIALLGNVDRSILQIELGNGFHIQEWPRTKFVEFCEIGCSEDVEYKLDNQWGYGHARQSKRRHVYVIFKEFKNYFDDHDKNLEPWAVKFRRWAIFEKNESDFLSDKITKLRLCIEGTINLCIQLYYKDDNGEIELDSSTEEGLYCENRLYKIKKSKIKKINDFLETPPLKLNHAYIHFALENFLESYRVAHNELEFIMLMIALEALFNDGKQELRYKISRGCAVLLGKTQAESKKIYEDLKELYNKRSTLVHLGDKSKLSEFDTILLKNYVRRGLFRAIELNLTKQNLAKKLTENGFGAFRRIG